MALSSDDILNHPGIRDRLRQRASDLLAMHVADPRSAGIFATHQRWLLAHLALAAHFEGKRVGGREVAAGVSSRNTAEAFLREMVRYGFIHSAPSPSDRRVRWLTVSPPAIGSVTGWLAYNLVVLDALDGGARVTTLQAAPDLIAMTEVGAARRFLETSAIRRPGETFRLFDEMNEGGAVMDRFFATHAPDPDDRGRHLTQIASLGDFGDNIRLSRSHLTRKLRAAEALGSIGWEGEKGKSRIWISRGFVDEYVRRQSAELGAIDAGFHAAREHDGAGSRTPAGTAP
jgi:hypothetical protein